MCQFANEDNLDFDDAVDKAPTQDFDVPQGREVGEYVVKCVSLNFIVNILFIQCATSSVLI